MTQVICKKKPLDRLRFLVVEDNEVQKLIFLKVLYSMNNITHIASNATEGWKLYIEISPDIVFLDIGLPDGSGNDLARKIKEHNCATHIIMATSNSDRANKEKAVYNRVDGFMVKPFNKKDIDNHIDRFRSLRRERMLHMP